VVTWVDVPTRSFDRGVRREYHPCAHRRKAVGATLVSPPIPPAQRATLSRAWEALLGVIAALGVTSVRWGAPSHNQLRLGLARYASWILVVASHSGVGHVVSILKNVAADARLVALTGTKPGAQLRHLLKRVPMLSSRVALEQLSFLGRALPEGDDYVRRRSLAVHCRTSLSPFTTPSDLLDRARAYARKFASKLSELKVYLPASPSASVGCGRRAGGTREDVRLSYPDWLRETGLGPEGWADLLAKMDPPSEESTVVLSNALSLPVAEAAAHKCVSPPLVHRICAVAERGWKQRIVSAPPAFASVAGTVLNKALLAGLRKERRCRKFLDGDRHLAVEEAMSHRRAGDIIVSTDLQNASDRLPLDLVEAIVSGLIEGWKGLSIYWAQALRVLTGPQLLKYPGGRVVNSERGILMGLGPTWPILSLVHLFWVDDSAARVGCRRAAYQATAIGGDDLIAAWPSKLVDCYVSTVRECGGSFSKGKAYFHELGGNFTELSFWVDGKVGTPIKWAGGIPLKGLVGTAPSQEGEAFESLCSRQGREHRARRVLKALRPDAWRKLRSDGVVPCVPRPLGGAGLPCLRGSPLRVLAPKWLRLAIGRYLYGSGDRHDPLGPPSWGESKDPVSLSARKRAGKAFSQGLEFGLIKVERSRSAPDGALGTAHAVVAMETCLFSEAAIFSGGPLAPSASGMAVPCRFARGVRAWARKTLRGGVPDRLAVREGRSSRTNLLNRLRSNRNEWFVIPLMEGVWPF
jgi:hypothetical protein